MNRTTRIKTAQAPRMYNIDLTDQLDGETQTFTLEKPINEQATYYVIWNGTTYRNDPQNTWFSFNETWDELTTYFDHAPTPGAHRSLILVVSEAADGSDVGTEVYMDSEHQDFVQIVTDENKVVSINGKAVSGISPEELQAIYDAIDDVSSDVSAVSRDLLAETLARSNADASLQAQIDAITASSDVKDIVGTKAELDQYDTSTLGDRDIIKVLQDETENNATTYYRWSTSTQTFTLIGEEGPYYTKSAVDALLLDKADKATTYTKTEVDALISAIPQPAVFTGATSTDAGTSGLVPAPAAGDEGKYLKGDGTWGTVQAGPTVVQATGTSTTDVMSQVATSQLIYPSGYETSKSRIKIGYGSNTGDRSIMISANSSSVSSGSSSINIGGSYARGYGDTIIGDNASENNLVNFATAIGYLAKVGHVNSIALGTSSVTSRTYELSIGSGAATNGTRFIANVTDPTLPQDAATKNYTDNLTISYAALNGTAAPTTATEGKYVGQLYYDTTNEQLYFLKEIDDTVDPVEYTWEAVGGGGGGIPTNATFWGQSYDSVNNKVSGDIQLYNGNALTSLLFSPSPLGPTSSYIRYNSNQNSLSIVSPQEVNFAIGNYARARFYTNRLEFQTVNGVTPKITNLADPTAAQDAATKNYVDTAVASAGAATYTNAEFNNLWENA